VGGRIPLVAGFLVLSASGLALAAAAGEQGVGPLIPGLLLQGLGLGAVLTVNDPTGLGAVPENDRGQAAGTINTTEQLGGALGIAALTAVEIGAAERISYERLADRGIEPTGAQVERFKEVMLEAEQMGKANVPIDSEVIRIAVRDSVLAHVDSFRITFLTTAGIALLGALTCFILVSGEDRLYEVPVFSRRSRWFRATAGLGPGITRHPPPEDDR
jgi:hypothetical protein